MNSQQRAAKRHKRSVKRQGLGAWGTGDKGPTFRCTCGAKLGPGGFCTKPKTCFAGDPKIARAMAIIQNGGGR